MSNIFMVGVDDSKINRLIYEEAAKLVAAECLLAEDGQDALNKINEVVKTGHIPTIIFTDIHMPNMNGIELIEKLKANPKTKFIPIIVLTTERDYEIKIQGKNFGAAGWITKPLSPDEIASVIKKFLKI